MINKQTKRIPTVTEALDAVKTLLAYIGDDPDRPGLMGTPDRVLRAWRSDWGRGYQPLDAKATLTLFEAEEFDISKLDALDVMTGTGMPVMLPADDVLASRQSKRHSQMVVVKDINLYSTCEHHLAPFWGVAHVAYLPSVLGLVGLSKLARVVDHYSRRLQMQERMTCDIADCLAGHLSASVAVMIEARHMCMISRGVQQPNSTTITTALRGKFLLNETVRSEFLAVIGKR